jgi:hypothetical protein
MFNGFALTIAHRTLRAGIFFSAGLIVRDKKVGAESVGLLQATPKNNYPVEQY